MKDIQMALNNWRRMITIQPDADVFAYDDAEVLTVIDNRRTNKADKIFTLYGE